MEELNVFPSNFITYSFIFITKAYDDASHRILLPVDFAISSLPKK
jgi:hypothetical protein